MILKIEKPYIKIKNAKFECPSCGSIISILQLSKKFIKPSKCSCGRHVGFKIINKELIEGQDIIIMEKETNFEYKAYIEGQKNIDKLKKIKDYNFITIKGKIQDEYDKKSTKGEFVIFVDDIKQNEEKKPAFLK